MINFVFRECFVLNIPLSKAQHSYDRLISHFLGRLGRHRALGGVRPLHVGHEQAHFLIGPPPLRVQLTVIPKGHLRLDEIKAGGGVRREVAREKKTGVNETDTKIPEVHLYERSAGVISKGCMTGARKPVTRRHFY